MQSDRPLLSNVPAAGLRRALYGAWMAAAGLCLVAAVPLGIYGLVSTYRWLSSGQPSISATDWLAVTATIFVTYFVAATLAAPVWALLRPIRRYALGWALTGAILAPIIYGTIGVAGYVAWEPAGRLLFGDTGDRASQLESLPSLAAFAAVLGFAGGLWFWWKDWNKSG